MSTAPPPDLLVRPLGEAALCCAVDAPVALEHQQRIWQLAAALARTEGVLGLIPGMNNLTLSFDPLKTDGDALAEAVLTLWRKPLKRQQAGRLVEIPVCYDGPDLADVAAHCGLTPDEVVRRHSAADYVVYFIGFQPGFAYLGGLDESLHTPRRAEPRTVVPAGSVGIGGAQTGIYPLATPGGWQLIGRSALPLFDPQAEPPTLLAPGDRVHFVAEQPS
ncbi:5-oxoprolinase subunit PxpB [Roseateles saccharophilus]|uniref:KipI family sensor histidine kinase inhibitor n=1 Tax=Roseateles saccharophilus TaxID=304 RepID=A0A4R3VIC2_ROSSA|nr:5-oxoprolinase subunit PxpB [Roseateles saccharophilus]MDG0832118.1 5-oxoprolinase subunit PxpB [Roseateles saccharophilus]TCV03528.1 KipI family sensor histidine kinase inhibitor [Roseateles saccharophilus]